MVEQKLEGLVGWLILVGIGVVISPIATTALAAATFVPFFQGDSWEYLTSRESPAYHVLWAPLLIGEILVNIGMIISWAYAAYLFFKKKSRFPAWYVGLLFFGLAFVVLDAFAIKIVLPDEPIFDRDTVRSIGRLLGVIVIWVPYIRLSRRVKITFVR